MSGFNHVLAYIFERMFFSDLIIMLCNWSFSSMQATFSVVKISRSSTIKSEVSTTTLFVLILLARKSCVSQMNKCTNIAKTPIADSRLTPKLLTAKPILFEILAFSLSPNRIRRRYLLSRKRVARMPTIAQPKTDVKVSPKLKLSSKLKNDVRFSCGHRA